MGQTKYNLNALSEKGNDLIEVNKRIDYIFNRFKIIKNSIDTDIIRRDNISNQFNSLISDFQNLIENTYNSSQIINKAVIEYSESEQQIHNLLNGLLGKNNNSFGTDMNEMKHKEVSMSGGSILQNWFERLYNQFISKVTHIKKFFEENGICINNKASSKTVIKDKDTLKSDALGNFKIGTYSKLEHYYDEDKINKFNPFMYIDPSGYFKEKEFFDIGKTPYVHQVIDCQNIIDCKSFEESNEDKFDLFNIDPKDVTRDAARWLIGNPVNAFITQHPYLTGFLTGVPIADIFYAAGFVMDDDGVYHARPDCLQQLGGYNDFYDIIFDYATSMKKDKFEFSSGGKDYIFWAWKGDYLNLGAGAELGIYSHDSGILGLVDITTPYDEHWLVDTNLSMPMTITLKYKGETIISYDPSKDKDNPYEKVWWITGFNPYEQGVQASELTATYTVSFKGNETMFIDFAKKYDLVDDRWDFDYDNFSATLNF